jgi:hypothetical protein
MLCSAQRSASQHQEKYAFDTAHNALDEGEYEFEKQFRVGFDVLVHLCFTVSIDDADVYFTLMQIKITIIVLLLFVKILA